MATQAEVNEQLRILKSALKFINDDYSLVTILLEHQFKEFRYKDTKLMDEFELQNAYRLLNNVLIHNVSALTAVRTQHTLDGVLSPKYLDSAERTDQLIQIYAALFLAKVIESGTENRQ